MTAPSEAFAVQAPEGSHFEFEEVKTKGGSESLGPVPILVWDDLDGAAAFYGVEAILSIMDGTSLRVSFQNIARRKRAAGKSDVEIAQEQLKYRPGKRQVGASTPTSRAARATREAVEKGVDADLLAQLVAKVAAGQIDLASLGVTKPAA